MQMKTLTILALAALAAPATFAQTYYYRSDAPLTRDELRGCMNRDDVLAARQSQIDDERRMNDRESASIARESATLSDEFRRLDSADTAAVAAYNQRTMEHNQRVDAHNLRVNDANEAARQLNRDQADMTATCGARTYYQSDRDAILWQRSR